VVAIPTLAVSLPSFGPVPGGGWRELLDLGRRAEDAGIGRLVLPDHVVMGTETDAYEWGTFPVAPDAPWLEPLTTLAALAAVTTQVRLMPGILIAPLRPAALLAKTAATLDHLSGGRLDLGVGTGWQRAEYEAEGLAFKTRGQLLTDTLGACRALWKPGLAHFDSPTISFADITSAPAPMQDPLPVWIAGTLHRANVARVVDYGDGWIPIMGASVEQIAAGVALLRGALAERGRDPAVLRVQAPAIVRRGHDGRPDLAGTMASVPALVDAGVTDVTVHLRAVCPPDGNPSAVFAGLVNALSAAFG
jgi:probable F420-dependent oxidoreductase